MTDLRTRMPAHALVEKVVSLRGTRDLRELPLGIVRPSRDAVAWLRGIRGEQEAARRLAALGPEWVVLHSIPIGQKESDVDHLVIGPPGVFVVNSKRHRDARVWVAGGRLLVNGRRTDHIRNSAFEATRIAAILQRAGHAVPVTPIVAISGARDLTVRATPEWKGTVVEVLHMPGLVRFLRKRGRRPAASVDVATLAALAARPETWSTRPVPESELEALRRDYDLIDRGTTRWNVLVGVIGVLVAVGIVALGYTLLGQVVSGLLMSLTR